ncbi:DNA-processing protein DprA [Paracrocinitomix mangrovi]|uniref:DNA-processing protein DprA n=1 Tax=Paracrocinitomix mangrovi TaxID=2862509 RepID=UPI001C8E70C9|nr:DNA-processing protein DprA [Paracrocinitomix mangrovi]UKN00836.1 DNA-processing protein DprA [Paracrocinitomix mangrovi]
MDERIYQIALSILNGLGPTTAKTLLEAIGSLEGIFKEKESNFRHIHGLRSDLVQDLRREECLIRAEQELEFIEKHNIQLYFYKDPNYPKNLKQCTDAPIVLFTMGHVYFNQRNISIVGTRKSSSYGKKMVDQLVKDFVPYEVQVISGLAHGIDKAAHEAAIRNNLPTIGVLGHGLDTMYPAAHRALAKQMMENGGIVTEFISGTIGEPTNFPKRNRIVAGLSEATIVVESSESGGSMITANLANDYNREVFAFPGNADKEFSSGCNNLIKRDKAHLITDVDDVIQVMNWEEKEKSEVIDINILEDLDPEESKLVNVFKSKGELNVDALAFETKLDSSNISVLLFNLELKGLVTSLPGKRYKLAQ